MKERFRMHQLPGDIGRMCKAMMLEKRWPERRRAKAFRKMHLARERAVRVERLRQLLREVEQ